ncbi:GNAT family protein [uncultured Draconibacterium sp.]|uniref:GNAT family N-acetyltransferase n=1 Tax=uncultured Draconibacterium sp. TaxID=1573823 RepID=UPI0032164481
MDHIRVNDKLRLEKVNLSMAKVVFDTIDNDREHLKQWLPFVDYTKQISDTEKFIASISNPENKKDLIYSIWHKEEFAGLVGFKDTDWANRKTEIGYWLTSKMQGKGIITSCVEKLIRFAFKNQKLNRIQIKAAKQNTKSASIPQKLGFTLEGVEREGELHQSGYFDLEVYSLLKSDLSK